MPKYQKRCHTQGVALQFLVLDRNLHLIIW